MALRWARWIDHLPLWVAWGATLSMGIYEPGELALMGMPLLAAAAVEVRRWDVSRHHRWLEVGALLYFLGQLARGHGFFTAAIHTLFLLAGVRLVLPREAAQQRQLVLMSFLLFLSTAMGPTDASFLVWTLGWFTTAAWALLQQSWEPSAALRRGSLSRPPFGRVPLWMGAALLLGTGFFLIMPRLNVGLRPRFLPGTSTPFGQAGLSDRLDLSGNGPIDPNPDVALRITPPPGIDPTRDPGWIRGLELLRGITLESVRDQRWEPAVLTPSLNLPPDRGPEEKRAEFLYTSNPYGILALPTGRVRLEPPDLPLMQGPGASARWQFFRARITPITVVWNPAQAEPREARLSTRRLDLLTHLEPSHEAARRASFRFAPSILPVPQLARTLEQALRNFTYTLDNPSGKAANPLEDFLERTQAGHCEYFASAMTLMLRARGVPARVVNGYRLGPWIPEGGYFRVSQNEAHSWVEYWHEGRWWTADPTPIGTAAGGARSEDLGVFTRWLDALAYRWDRYVVRFSDQDQQTGLSWIQTRMQDWEWHWKTPKTPVLAALGLMVVAWALWRTRDRWQPEAPSPARIRALRPMLLSTRRQAPPLPGETARTWLMRLSALRPERLEALRQLADSVDAQAYGSGNATAVDQAKAEAAAWRGWKPPA
ncbi:transglutaminase [Geothrix limicola]|uniref:Transglutaminase n=1 Tax=Geothrix limicola TaxID=2927978 RepID=A0ABQ5QJ02_9BACT|nr:transglutaminaseTgpA domain-containing protein [Geothrix limicola]GLH74009.1 transglutaminase [Geothrix limicola]